MTLSELRTRERELAREIRAVRQKIKKARPKMARPAAPGPDPAARRAEHRASTKELRRHVWERCGGLLSVDELLGEGHCEACAFPLGAVWEMHHVEQGGLRRSRQREGSVLALCMDCHRGWHRNDLEVLELCLHAPSLDAEARRSVQRRFDKVLRVRGVPVHVEEER